MLGVVSVNLVVKALLKTIIEMPNNRSNKNRGTTVFSKLGIFIYS